MGSNEVRWNRPAVHAAHDAFRRAMSETLTHAAHVLEYDRLSSPEQALEARRLALTALGRAEEALTRMEIKK
jgi:hypothetical protein